MEIDKITPYLIERKTGKIIDTEIHQIEDVKTLKKIQNEHNWSFDWVKQWNKKDKNSEFYKITLQGDRATQGITEIRIEKNSVEWVLAEVAPHNKSGKGKYIGGGPHLAAVAIKRSFEIGGEGYIYFDAKTELVKHYEQNLGAKIIFGRRMMIETKEAKKILSKYFPRRLRNE